MYKMEYSLNISETINEIIKQKGITKKFVAERVISLKPILKSTGETPSLTTIYGYLNGSREIKAELLPYIAEVLDITIGELFEEDEKVRFKILQKILKAPNEKEVKLLKQHFKTEETLYKQKIQNDSNNKLYNYIAQLLPYSSEKFLYKLIDVLESFKDSTKIANEEIKS